MTTLSLDWESACDIDLLKFGLDNYSAHPSARLLMGAYAFDNETPKLWVAHEGPMPADLREALLDPSVERWAFNAAFERVMARRVAKLKTPIKGWRCTKVLAHMQSFTGSLDAIGAQVGLDEDKQKLAEGKRLIRLFTQPQKVTKNQPHLWRDWTTDPEDWEMFKAYCLQDVVAERAIKNRLIRFPVPPVEWEYYEIDQAMNDRGCPLDVTYVRQAERLGAERKAELVAEMIDVTGLANPNSPAQLKPWLQERGYPFDDLRKETIKKVLAENADQAGDDITVMVEGGEGEDVDTVFDTETRGGGFLTPEAVKAMTLRQQAARTSVGKYTKALDLVGPGNRLRNIIQFHGAARTGRDAGRGVQVQNLGRTPGELEADKIGIAAGLDPDSMMDFTVQMIRQGDLDALKLCMKEPMNALAGLTRAMISTEAMEEDTEYDLVAADLASIETCVIGWVSGCERLLDVFRTGKDAYKDFGTDLYEKAYDEITKQERTDSKPAVLGCGFRLGPGDLKDGKRTGLWGYAEGMGINLSRQQCVKAVKKYRTAYPEIPGLWFALEDAVKKAMREGRKVRPVIKLAGKRIEVPVTIELMKPYLLIWLPSGRPLFYYKPRLVMQKMPWVGEPTKEFPDGEPIYKESFSYMGKAQNGNAWVRLTSHGGKLTENIVQAIARDILFTGLKRAAEAGFKIILRVHDELVALVRRGDNRLTMEYLVELMTELIEWCPDIPLKAEGWKASYYRK